MSIDSILKSFQRFGVHLGLDRIQNLLAELGNPHHQIPIIHVGGTNGKGSVCAYLSSILTEAGYTVGRYISPHLVDWTERICINNQPICEDQFESILTQIQGMINPDQESPTQFEMMTAAAWVYFAQHKVDIAVIEVGLGGRLDATNVCDRPLVSVITSISREHWQTLGPTVADIAGEKAGILKADCPAVIGSLPPDAKAVFISRLELLNCPTRWVEPATRLKENWAQYQGIEYPLPLLGEMQLSNSAIAIATVQILQRQGWNIPLDVIQKGMAKTQWLGRLQWTKWRDYPILVDGAHNPAAAAVLRQYVDTLEKPVTWVMGILSTKDHQEIFQTLLKPQDCLYLVPVPDHSTADPKYLSLLAQEICPELGSLKTFPNVFAALETAIALSRDKKGLIVLCGSLYLIGYFLRHKSSVVGI